MHSLYPASPSSPPASLTKPSAGYLARVILVLSGLAAFVALYVGIGVALVYSVRALWALELHGRGAIYVVGGGTVVLLALLLFLVKGLFFRDRASRDGFIEVTAAEQPKLFAFLEQLLRETGAPRPRKVYVTADVNAMVFYEPSLLSLFMPTPKSLVIGLGLVNHLTLSELKAVLGHELGHFSQRAMKIGAYVYVAHRVVANLVYGRDAFDDLLEEGKRTDYRIAIIAYFIAGVVWLLRGVLRVAFEIVALGHRALGRDMEFAADRMAVSVAGGDAIARGLCKAEVADACFGAALMRLTHAADEGIVTEDFFVHQTCALGEVRSLAKRPRWGEPDDRVEGFLFASDGTSKPSMWATHPPSAERERAARAHGVETEHDERSAWLLFDDAPGLRAKATIALMRQRIPHANAFPKPAAEVEELLERERRETEIVSRAGEMYTGRLLAPLELDALFARTPRPREALEIAHAALHGAEVDALNVRFRASQSALQLLSRAQHGQLRESALVVDGAPRALADVPALFEEKLGSLAEIDRGFEAEDRRVAEVHAEMAIELGEKTAKRLRRAYADVLRYGRWLKSVRDAQSGVGPWLTRLQSGERLDDHGRAVFLERAEALRASTSTVVSQARERKAPKFLALAEGAKLGAFLLPRHPPPRVADAGDVGAWLGQVLGDAAEVIDKLQRLHHRAIAALLHRHDEVHAAWAKGERDGDAAEVDPDDLTEAATP